ncbi:GNAT family N-acetyltransferase [Limosilactobacillus mucosae]
MTKIDIVHPQDLAAILRIERLGFNEAEAGTAEQYQARINQLADTFLVARDEYDRIAGFIVGPAVDQQFEYIEDWMYEADVQNRQQPGGNQTIQTIAVDPVYRGQGIGSQLLSAFEDLAIKNQRHHIALTCLIDRVPFYEKNGYVNRGIAASEHAGEIWHNMTKLL